MIKPNSNQQKVINHERGPLLVVAGAGTGKTGVIVGHISRLLNEGVEPRSILALTFTEKAAQEMLGRLLEGRAGFELDMPIMTFNAYGESMLRRYAADIGLPRNFTLLGENAQIIFLREHLDKLGLDYFNPVGRPDAVLGDIAAHFSRLKQHVVKPEEYQKFAEKLPTGTEAERLDKKKYQELAQIYQRYIELCRSNAVIDYDDQIYLLIELLERRPNIREELRNAYHTILVDEFQDTNPMQSKLIDLLINDKQNLIVVGDDDQSIYGFRGATLRNILEFKDRYPKAKDITLVHNYRSGQKILDAAYRLISNNTDRLETRLQISKRLLAEHDGVEPEIKHFENQADELSWIAKDIKDRIAALKKGDNVSIAVLTRSNATAASVAAALEVEGIEHVVIGHHYQLYDEPVVRTLIEAFRCIADPEDNMALYHTLTGELFTIDARLLSPISAGASRRHVSLAEEIESSEIEGAREALNKIDAWRSQSSVVSIHKLAYKILWESGYVDRARTASETDPELEEQLSTVFGRLDQYFRTLKSFEKIAIQPSVSAYVASLPALLAAGESNEDDTLDLSESKVNVLTVHKAKGLEWDVVYIARCNDRSFPYYGATESLPLPEGLAPRNEADDKKAEERRLMYVAVTRARRNLCLTYCDGGSGSAPSPFLKEMFGEEKVLATPAIPSNTELTFDILQQNNSKPRGTTTPLPGGILSEDGSVKLSFSKLDTYLRCPYDFYYRYILRVPDEPSSTLEYGSALHKAIEEFNIGKMNGDIPPLEDLLNVLELNFPRLGFASRGSREKSFAKATTTLSNFYEKHLRDPAKVLYAEEPFRIRLPESNTVLTGRYDAVTEQAGKIEIRDYKTGNVDTQKKADGKKSSEQLTVYAMAWLETHGSLPDRVTLEFVDTGLEASVRKQQASIDTIRKKIMQAADGIRAHKFPMGNRHDYCHHPH